MAVLVVPTLQAMIDIYSLSTVGGDRSERFLTYVDACRAGERLHGYNPMTTKPVAEVLERMATLDAERLLLDAGSETLEILGVDDDIELFISVTAPGIWTDRQATAIDHAVAPRHFGELLLWFDDPLDSLDIRTAAIEQTVRVVWWARRHSQPKLDEIAYCEGLAGALAGCHGVPSGVAAETVEVLGEDASRATAVAYLFGDESARHLGYPPLGLDDNEGRNHSIAAINTTLLTTSTRDVARETLRNST